LALDNIHALESALISVRSALGSVVLSVVLWHKRRHEVVLEVTAERDSGQRSVRSAGTNLFEVVRVVGVCGSSTSWSVDVLLVVLADATQMLRR
jgi:hypothetical protein